MVGMDLVVPPRLEGDGGSLDVKRQADARGIRQRGSLANARVVAKRQPALRWGHCTPGRPGRPYELITEHHAAGSGKAGTASGCRIAPSSSAPSTMRGPGRER